MGWAIRIDLLPAYGIHRYLSPFMTVGRILWQDIQAFLAQMNDANGARSF